MSKKIAKISISKPNDKELLATLVLSAQAAGKILKKYYLHKFQIREKPGAGLVTNADLESEEAATRILRKYRPDFGFLTEENKPQQSQSLGRWIIDPLDGTTNFVHGFPMFCVSVAAEWDGEVIAGVVYHPILKDTYTAILGKGAFVNGKRMRVSKTPKLTESLLTTGFTYRKDDWLRQEMVAFERLSEVARAVRRPGSAALDLAYTARGVFDGFWERRLSPWDVAAGALLVQEAGGRVSNFSGDRYKIDGKELIASNGTLHEDLLKAVHPDTCPKP